VGGYSSKEFLKLLQATAYHFEFIKFSPSILSGLGGKNPSIKTLYFSSTRLSLNYIHAIISNAY
jgi:hypothetical protein